MHGNPQRFVTLSVTNTTISSRVAQNADCTHLCVRCSQDVYGLVLSVCHVVWVICELVLPFVFSCHLVTVSAVFFCCATIRNVLSHVHHFVKHQGHAGNYHTEPNAKLFR